MIARSRKKVSKYDKMHLNSGLRNSKHYPSVKLLILLIFWVFVPASSALSDIVKKDFVVIYWNKIGWTDNSVTLNNTRYPAGTKLPVLLYETSKSGERIVVIRAKSGRPEGYPLKYFTGGYESAGHIVKVNWDTVTNHITVMDTNDQQWARAYHHLILLLHANLGSFLVTFSIIVFFLLLLKIAGFRGVSWGFPILGYVFLLLGGLQGSLYADYLRAFDRLDWFALKATLPTKGSYEFLNVLFIPLMLGFLVSIPIALTRAFLSKGVSKPLPASAYSSSGGYSPGVTIHSDNGEKVNPFLKAGKIDKAILSDDKILRNSSGEKVGTLEKAIFSNDQIIRAPDGSKAGRIEQSIWDKDKQIIKGADGQKEGEIKTDIGGNRVIVDKEGKKVGRIEKNIGGETVIKKN